MERFNQPPGWDEEGDDWIPGLNNPFPKDRDAHEPSLNEKEFLRGLLGKDERYKFFEKNQERNELFEYCKSIAEYLHDEHIPNFVVIDRSSRPIYIGVREYWHYKYPDEKSPNVYFMNPAGFKTKTEVGPGRRKVDVPVEDLKTQEEVVKELGEVYAELSKDKEEPVLVFDSCIHSGGTLFPVKRAMQQAGFEDIRIGSINPAKESSTVQTDFYITKDRPEKGCYPFDSDRMIEKVFYSLHSEKNDDEDDRERSIRLRKEIQKIMEEKIGEEKKDDEL